MTRDVPRDDPPSAEGFAGFEDFELDLGDAAVFGRRGGTGPAVVLLHGFPETSAMWRDVAPILADRFTVVCPDLRGYGRSGTPASGPDHAAYSTRALASDVVATMRALGHERFAVVGHDRGGRVAYRLALDHSERVTRLVALDVVPIDSAWQHADDRFALGFWPWSLLAQPAPLPERLVLGAPDAVLDHALSPEWGTPSETFPPWVRAEYQAQLADPPHVHAICEEYRAGADIDRRHDREDGRAGRRIDAPTLVLWSGAGPLGSWYEELGGPLALWRPLAPNVSGSAVDGGHFFPEEHPERTAATIASFVS